MGVEIQLITAGDGKNYPKMGDRVTIHYEGTLLDGTKFDSSFDRHMPFETIIGVGNVIKGWDEAVPQMSLGERSKLTITGDYGYGERYEYITSSLFTLFSTLVRKFPMPSKGLFTTLN